MYKKTRIQTHMTYLAILNNLLIVSSYCFPHCPIGNADRINLWED